MVLDVDVAEVVGRLVEEATEVEVDPIPKMHDREDGQEIITARATVVKGQMFTPLELPQLRRND